MSEHPTATTAGGSPERKAHRLLPVIGAIVAGTLMSLLAFTTVLRSDRNQLRSDFERMATNRALALENAIARHLEVLRFTRRLFVASNYVDRQDFDQFLGFAIDEYPGLDAMGWVTQVTDEDRPFFEETARSETGEDFTFLEYDSTGLTVAAARRPDYLPLYYVTPRRVGDPTRLGIDMGSTAELRQFVRSADGDDEIVVSPVLDQPDVQGTFLAVIRVRSTTGSPRFPDGTPQPVVSYLVGLYSLEGLVEATIGAFENRVDFILYDPGIDQSQGWAQRYDAPSGQLQPLDRASAAVARDASIRLESAFRVGDQQWVLVFYSPPGYLAARNAWQAWAVLFAGLIVTASIVSYLYGSLRRSEKLASLNARLEDALRSRDEVLGVVAHDLRNPLNTIRLSVGVLLDQISTGDGRPGREQPEIIQRSVERADTLIQDLLDVTKVEAGRLSLDQEPIDSVRLLNEAADLHRSQAAEKGLELETTRPQQLPPLSADHDRVLQVFSNLIANAVKFTPPGGKILLAAQPNTDHLEFRVSDNGPGVPQDQVGHLFEPFWQGTGGEVGAGLGLSIAKGIVEAHGGHIWFETEVGNGTTFYFTLPTVSGATPSSTGTTERAQRFSDRYDGGEQSHKRAG